MPRSIKETRTIEVGRLATAVHAPVLLEDEIPLTASSWEVVGLNPPCGGTVDISIDVDRGNPIDAFLTLNHQLDEARKVGAKWVQNPCLVGKNRWLRGRRTTESARLK
jgi:hypothetical protein